MLSTFEVVAEPHRRRILDLLRVGDRSVGELVGALGLSQPAVSKHLKVLRTARLVESEVEAQRRLYRLSPEPLRELEEWLEPYRQFWSERLDALGRHLDAQKAARTSVKQAQSPSRRAARSTTRARRSTVTRTKRRQP